MVYALLLQDVESIGDLSEQLCKKLDYQVELLWIVNIENANIYEDDVMMNKSTKASCSLMLGNKMRAECSNEDMRKYNKSNKSAVKCRMECDHLKVISDNIYLLNLDLYMRN